MKYFCLKKNLPARSLRCRLASRSLGHRFRDSRMTVTCWPKVITPGYLSLQLNTGYVILDHLLTPVSTYNMKINSGGLDVAGEGWCNGKLAAVPIRP